MTSSPNLGSAARTGLEALADAALLVIDELSAGDLLAAITPERLGARSGYAASSVRYQLSRVERAPAPQHQDETTAEASRVTPPPRKRWAFDREHVLLIALSALAARQRQAAEESVARYLSALSELKATGDPRALAQAVQADLDIYTPGATADATALTSERVQSIAVAAADGSIEIARQLRRHQDERLHLYLPVYEHTLTLSGRVLRDGVTLLDLAKQVSFLLEGVAQRRRSEPALDESHVLRTVLAIFHGLTRPGNDTEALDPEAALVQAFIGGSS